MSETPPPSAPPSPVSRAIEFAKEWGAVTTIPSAVLAVVCQALGVRAITTLILTLSVFVLFGLLLLRPNVRAYATRLKQQLRLAPWVLVMGLAAACVYLLYPAPEDLWRVWERDVLGAAARCGSGDNKQIDDCVAKALTSRRRPHAIGSGAFAALAADLRAGTILLSDPYVKGKLSTWLGIGENFLGTGFSLPLNEQDPSEARIPEVLVPNFKDSDTGVWTWILDPAATNLAKTVSQIIYDFDPEQLKHPGQTKANLEAFRSEIKQRITERDARLPPVVRFAQPKKYSGCLGLPERVRVFASHLEPVITLRLKDAGDLSGYALGPDRPQKLYVMVFVPSHPDQVVPATWPRILEKLPQWVGKERPCPE